MARKRAEASQKKKKSGRIDLQVIIISKQRKGVSELAAAGI
jgi:hypothetical protein